MVILSISVAGMLAALTMGRENINVPDHQIAALNYAQETIEELKGKTGTGVLVENTYGPDSISGELGAFGGTRKYTVTNIPLGSNEDNYHYKKVTVTVHWDEPE